MGDDRGKGFAVVATNIDGDEVGIPGDVRDLGGGAVCSVGATAGKETEIGNILLVFIVEDLGIGA